MIISFIACKAIENHEDHNSSMKYEWLIVLVVGEDELGAGIIVWCHEPGQRAERAAAHIMIAQCQQVRS